MARPKRTRKAPVQTTQPQPQTTQPQPVQETPQQVSLSVRLPGPLAMASRQCSEATGISLNALVCVALSRYLQDLGYRIHPATPGR